MDKDRFYYVDLINKDVYCRQEDPNWDHKYDYERVSVYDSPSPNEEDSIYEFEDEKDLWENFKIDGKDLAYILLHSVIWLST